MTMFDKPQGFEQPAGFDQGAQPVAVPDPGFEHAQTAPAKRPNGLSLGNWPVRRKVLAIALVPLLLAAVFGGIRIYSSWTQARELRLAADRTELVQPINNYMGALENMLVATPDDVQQAKQSFDQNSTALRERLDSTDVVPDVRLAVTTLLDYGRNLVDKVGADQVDLRQRVTTFAPLLLTSETAITGSVRVDDEQVRLEAEGLARAVGSRGQMAMQRMLVEQGDALPEPILRSSMIGLAGTEPNTVTGMASLLGGASEQANTLRSQMVQRLSTLSDPTVSLVGNQELLQSISATNQIAQSLIDSTTSSITSTVDAEANQQRNNAIRDALIVLAAILIALAIVVLVARSLTRPLRTLRDSALKIAHEDLATEIERVKAGDEREPLPLPIHTSEEIGQVAHAVDELHTQALLLAGDEARLRVMVNDMFETLSRRNKTLVDQQLSLIDRLERNEQDSDRLDSLFRLDHLATRMRRNGANLLVLAGAQVTRDQSQPVPLVSLINAAASEVEDYQRVETGMVPDCSVTGAAAGDSVHLLAELVDNALRYSPPNSQVRVTAVHTSDGGVLIDVFDAGLGMTDGDLRIANMRLNAGGEVSPDNTRHMGLFVVGRLARQHGMVVRLLPGTTGNGTIAQAYLPPQLLDGYVRVEPGRADQPPAVAPDYTDYTDYADYEVPAAFVDDDPPTEPGRVAELEEVVEAATDAEPEGESESDGDASVTLLPRRSPGSSGITGTTAEQPFGQPEEPAAPSGRDWWGGGQAADEAAAPAEEQPEAPAAEAPSNTAGFFASRRLARRQAAEQQDQSEVAPEPEVPEETDEAVDGGAEAAVDELVEEHIAEEAPTDGAPVEEAPAEEAPVEVARPARSPQNVVDTGSLDLSDMDRLARELSPHPTSTGVDLIYQNMLSEWLVDPHELATTQDWKSVWDNGWAAAADAENVPVESHTDHGLPVRAPGARLIPGGTPVAANGTEHDDGAETVAANSGQLFGEPNDRGAIERDPDAIRASMSNHFGGVRAARTHTSSTSRGREDE